MKGIRVVARVLVVSDVGELLLCRNRAGTAWVPPGGTLELGETLAEAAQREAEEEVGLQVSVGRLVYVQEFRPANWPEHVIEHAFLARTASDQPAAALAAQRGITPIAGGGRPWAGWWIQDVDGPRREVRWFSQAGAAALSEPLYPSFLRERFWATLGGAAHDPYLGLTGP